MPRMGPVYLALLSNHPRERRTKFTPPHTLARVGREAAMNVWWLARAIHTLTRTRMTSADLKNIYKDAGVIIESLSSFLFTPLQFLKKNIYRQVLPFVSLSMKYIATALSLASLAFSAPAKGDKRPTGAVHVYALSHHPHSSKQTSTSSISP
jgi:hypothetical protein